MQFWLQDHLATSLDLYTILGSDIIKMDCSLIKDQWKSFNVNVPRVGWTVSSQLFSYRFTHGSSSGMTSINCYA